MPAADFDVCIIGANWAAALLAAVLARRHQRVAICWDKTSRESGVEATIPYTTTILEIIGERYGSPEIYALGRYESVRERVTPNVQRNRHLTFLYHSYQGVEDLQFNFPGEHSEYCIASREWTQYLLACGARDGVEVVEYDGQADVTRGGEVAEVVCDGRRMTCQCVVRADGGDASGINLPEALLYEQSPLHSYTALLCNTRDTTTPMLRRGFASLKNGTVHHVFDGGFVRLIEVAKECDGEDGCWAHMVLDETRFGPDAKNPDAAWDRFKSQHQEIGQQFDCAVLKRGWEEARRVGGENEFVAERFCALDPRAIHRSAVPFQTTSGAIDLILTLTHVLLDAASVKDYSFRKLQPFATHQNAWIRQYDQLLTMTVAATRGFALWNAVVRVWLLDSILATLRSRVTFFRYKRSRDPRILEEFDRVESHGWAMRYPPCRTIFAQAAAACEEVLADRMSTGAAAATIFDTLRAAKFSPPIFPFADAQARCYHLNLSTQIKTAYWVLFVAPADMRRLFLDYFRSIVYYGVMRVLAFILSFLRPKTKAESVP